MDRAEAGGAAEQERWAAEIATVRAWRRPTWPVWLITAVLVARPRPTWASSWADTCRCRRRSRACRLLVGPAVNVIGVGVDLVDLERVARLLAHKGEHAMQKFFTDEERAYLATRPDPTGHAAARIAAKEAVYKALQSLPGARGVGWREIEVTRDGDGRPAIRLHGLAARLAAEHGGLTVQVSLTHSAMSAGAVAVVARTET